jgi:hypothetical protein
MNIFNRYSNHTEGISSQSSLNPSATEVFNKFPKEFSWNWHNPSAASNPSGH